MTTRKVRYYLRLRYPVQVTAAEAGFAAAHPDLPGCACEHPELSSLYATLERKRRTWIAERLQAGNAVPLPNSYLCTASGQRAAASL